MKLREKVIDEKQGDERLDILKYIKDMENYAVISSDGNTFGLNGFT